MDLKTVCRTIYDFPHEGIIFRDITPILQHPEALQQAVNQMADKIKHLDFDLIVSPESRGFIFGVPLAYVLGKGFVPMRKAGKLPFKTVSQSYDLEYGTATIEAHADAIKPGQRVVIADDLLATGGTCQAMAKLIEEMGGTVAATVFLIELEALQGRDALAKYENHAVMAY